MFKYLQSEHKYKKSGDANIKLVPMQVSHCLFENFHVFEALHKSLWSIRPSIIELVEGETPRFLTRDRDALRIVEMDLEGSEDVIGDDSLSIKSQSYFNVVDKPSD